MEKRYILLLILLVVFLDSSFATGSGCCEPVCLQTTKEQCYGNYHDAKQCFDLDECNVGCCVDKEGYCLSNYLSGNCAAKGGQFVSDRECPQYYKCLMPPQNPLVGNTGYTWIFERNANGFDFVNPIANTIGNPFVVHSYVFNPNPNKQVIAKIYDGSYYDEIYLFDDGRHLDGNSHDGHYAGIWDSAGFPRFLGIKKIKYKSFVDGKETKSESTFLLSENNCLPLTANWEDPQRRKDIVFIGSAATNEDAYYFKNVAGAFISYLAQFKNIKDEIPNMNFYIINSQFKNLNIDAAKQKVKEQCKFFSEGQDMIIMLDNNFETCEQATSIVRINPNFGFKKDAAEFNSQKLLNDFCRNALTEKQLYEYANLFYPNVTLISPQNDSTFAESNEITVKFKADSMYDAKLKYLIYLDNDFDLIAEGEFDKNQETDVLANISDGPHVIYVEAQDVGKESGWSSQNTILVNVSNFMISLTSLEDYSFDYSPKIEFSITNAAYEQVNYTVYVDDKIFSNEITQVNRLISLDTDLVQGYHTIRVEAEDELGRKAKTMPYRIVVRSPGTSD